MKLPEGFEMTRTGAEVDAVQFEVTVRPPIHRVPPSGSGLMPCCNRTPFEVPCWHRMTLEPDDVTCAPTPRPTGGETTDDESSDERGSGR